MRLYGLLLAALLSVVSAASAITVEEVARLAQLKTSDDVILQLIRENPPDKPLSPAQVIYLRENGVSEAVLSTLLHGSSESHPEDLPKQDSESHWIDGSARYYYTTAADGSKKMVVTNLDETGRRMGPPPPPRREEPPPQQPVQETYQAPQEYPYAEPQRDDQFERPYWNGYDQYPPYNAYQAPPAPYYDSYASYGFIPDYPGSTFGFHLLPTFTVVHSSSGFAGHSFSRHSFSHGNPSRRCPR